jgi:hypothetical protein
VNSKSDIVVPAEPLPTVSGSTDAVKISSKQQSLLLHMIAELRHTLTAAIVGLTFPNARDVALNSLACLRRASVHYRNTNDLVGVEAC